VEIFRALPRTAIYARGLGELRPVPGQPVPDGLDLLALSETVLGRGSEERLALLVWARAKATDGDVGGTVSEVCLAKGWKRSTFEERRRRACRRLAEAIAPAA
jgi:hypothetical protein